MTDGNDDNHVDRLLGVVIAHLEEMEVSFARYPDRPAVVVRFPTESAFHSCLIRVSQKRPVLLCILNVACRVPAEKRPAAAELLTRINYGLSLGAFEMDFRDGEVRFRTGIDVGGGELAPEMVRSLIGATVTTVDRYHPAIMTFLWNDMSPDDAVALIEGKTER